MNPTPKETTMLCQCGQELRLYAYSETNGQYNAWRSTGRDNPDGTIYAADRNDALHFVTAFRPPRHQVLTSDGVVAHRGTCQE